MFRPVWIICATLVAQISAQCSYSTLQEAATSYVVSRGTGQITALSGAIYTENFKAADIKSSILTKPLRIDHNRSSHDTTSCATYTELIVTDRAHPYVIGTQMRFDTTGKVIQIDNLVTDAGDWAFNATGTLNWAQKESWSTIPAEKRDARATIQKAADAYLDLWSNKSTVVPWGHPCARLEGGSYTGQGLPTDSCDVGVPTRIVYMTNRRYVIDETVGAVDVFVNIGNCSTSRPDSHEFRVEGGKIRYIHTMTIMDPKCGGLPSQACECGARHSL